MNAPAAHVAQRIRSELIELDRVLQRIQEGWKRAERAADDFYLDSVALNLHGFYSGLERIFEVIASNLDGSRPEGENWHQQLLDQMAAEVLEARPAVISKSTCERLNEYRGFRHVVRNVYTYRFDTAKLKKLIEGLPGLFQQLRAELMAFADFAEKRP
jgi:uncharacterized protein YutE (UPF0331/DUF86 family)